MPLYEYECSCGHSFKELGPVRGRLTAKCPKCARRAGKVMSVPGAPVFRGSGFYETDYKKKEQSTEKD